ncbi:hypothetical protein RQM47_08710 [Rubrivirga sp. S365]|uniref:Uncharacterized protein n=1 Tax=Rubrivirga litoralis TaxID=3075598 RepID=A0ABU3BTH3_9BACT|nr:MULTISPECIES: hypothetical protein [unclassified Rubrivirga]MDT0632592.1 hypothetical protein [Rubrivirga sp. F394]MDT7856718.1 hypothetical protein [Rubrivirga sp. S365]
MPTPPGPGTRAGRKTAGSSATGEAVAEGAAPPAAARPDDGHP